MKTIKLEKFFKKLKSKKCYFCKKKTVFLSSIISPSGFMIYVCINCLKDSEKLFQEYSKGVINE